MACIHTTIAEAVKDALNAATLSQTIAATRVYAPDLELRSNEDAIAVRVWPAPEGRVSEFASRSTIKRDYPIYVAVLRKCDVDTNATVDAYAALLEEIEDLFVGATIEQQAALAPALMNRDETGKTMGGAAKAGAAYHPAIGPAFVECGEFRLDK